MHKTSIVISLLAFASAQAATLTYEQAKALADRDEASLANPQALVESQGNAAGPSFAKCPPESSHPDLSPFTVVMELDKSGKVVRTWLRGSSPIAVCFRQQMSTKSLFKPPRAPFYTSFEMSWH